MVGVQTTEPGHPPSTDERNSPAQPGCSSSPLKCTSHLGFSLDEFNKTWGNSFSNPDHVTEIIKDMPDRVNEDEAYQNAKMNSDRQNARIEHDAALKRQITAMLRDNTELYRKYTEDQAFQDDLNGMIFKLTYQQ